MVIGASVYLVVGHCAAAGLINLPSRLMIVVVWLKLRACSLSNTMRKAQIDTVVIIIFVRLITELHLLYSPGQRHLIANQNTEAFNVINIAGNQDDFNGRCLRFSLSCQGVSHKWLCGRSGRSLIVLDSHYPVRLSVINGRSLIVN